MTDDEFRKTMCDHMAKQTVFLEQINDGMKAVRWIGKTLATVFGVVMAYFAAADYFGWAKHK